MERKTNKHRIVVLDFRRHIKSQGQPLTLPSTDFSCINHVNILTTNLEPISIYHFSLNISIQNDLYSSRTIFSGLLYILCEILFRERESESHLQSITLKLFLFKSLFLFSQLPSPLAIGCRRNQRSKH